MARLKIVHKDLKPENILVHSKLKGNYDIRIADFGYACQNDEIATNKTESHLICGTGGYIAPEALDGSGYSLKTDIFSVGSILYCLLTRHNLFNATVNYELLMQNKTCNIKHIDDDLSLYSPLVKNLLKQMLTIDPKKRLSAEGCLKHPWLVNEQPPIKASLTCNKIINDKMKSDRSKAIVGLYNYIKRDRTPSPNAGAQMMGNYDCH